MTRTTIRDNATWAVAIIVAAALCIMVSPLAIIARVITLIRESHTTRAQVPRRGHIRHGDSTSHGIA